MGPRPWPVEDMPMDDIGIECLAFKERFWYPEVMSNESHWVPIAEDPLSCIGDQSLYDVRRLAIIFVIQAAVETKHQIELLRVVQNQINVGNRRIQHRTTQIRFMLDSPIPNIDLKNKTAGLPLKFWFSEMTLALN